MIKNFLKALAYGILLMLFPIAAGVIITLKGITDTTTIYLIQGICFALGSIIGLILYKSKFFGKEIAKGQGVSNRALLYFIPIIFLELIVLFGGITKDMSAVRFITLLFFTISVGVAEEVFVRGLMLNTLKPNGIKYAIITSSVLFGILHLSNILGGADPVYTALQIIFAGLFGFTAANIVVLQGSLIPVIIWHFIHDFLAFFTGNSHSAGQGLGQWEIIVAGVQAITMLIYALFLYKKIKKI